MYTPDRSTLTGAAGASRLACLGLLAALVAGCGGSGGGDSPAPVPVDPALTTARIEAYVCGTDPRTATPTKSLSLVPSAVPTVLRLGAPSQAKAQAGAVPGTARQIGLGRDVAETADPAATARQLAWGGLASGGRAAAIAFKSDGATSVRIGLLVRQLPANATVRAYGPMGENLVELSGQEVLATLQRNAQSGDRSDAGRTYWMAAVAGDQATIEIELPAGVPASQVQVAVPRISHLYESALQADAGAVSTKIGESGGCNQDAMCAPAYAEVSKAVARIEFVDQGSTFLCNGTLLADSVASGTPYFLSANHCVSNQTAASSITSYWFYRSSACNSGVLSSEARLRTGGAALLYASASTDTAFMKLNATPPAGAVCAGSLLTAPSLGTGITALHNPKGDLQKISQGSLIAYGSCADTSCSRSSTSGNFLALQWTSGTTEGGSSGSAALATVGSKQYVVGQLFAGSASCSAPTGTDFYGRLDVAYSAALAQWLTPVR